MRERLQKIIAEAGIASRRHAEELISSGQVTVNGEQIIMLGYKSDPEKDHIKVRGRLINPLLSQRKNIYVVLNKPKGYLTSMDDPQERIEIPERIFKSHRVKLEKGTSLSQEMGLRPSTCRHPSHE